MTASLPMPKSDDCMFTTLGFMSFSQFVGSHLADALKSTGLWDDRAPLDRLRDMNALSMAAIYAMHKWQERVIEFHDEGPLA